MSTATDTFTYYLGEAALHPNARITLAIMRASGTPEREWTVNDLTAVTGLTLAQQRSAFRNLRENGHVSRYRHSTVIPGPNGDYVTTVTRYTLT